MAEKPRNEGEGSRTAARAYNKHAEKHARSGDVGKEARAAEESLSGPEGSKLKQAEKAGKAKAREESPAVKRDYGHKA